MAKLTSKDKGRIPELKQIVNDNTAPIALVKLDLHSPPLAIIQNIAGLGNVRQK
jgi:hypothetical protein